MFTLETERCILRPFKKSDVKDLFEMESDPLIHKYLGNNPLSHIDQASNYIDSILEQYKQFGLGRLAVIEKSTSDFLGWSGLKFEEKVRSYAYYDIGYRFKVSAWGKGIATETAIVAVNHGFDHLHLNKICGAADVDNIGSNRILTKLGMHFTEQFNFEGILHNWYEIEK